MAVIPTILLSIASASILNGLVLSATVPGTDRQWLVSRDDWMAEPPVKESLPLVLPVSQIGILDSSTSNCVTKAECTSLVRAIQKLHKGSLGLGDIAWNFLIGGDGTVYVGRGWEKQGPLSVGYTPWKTITIAFIGIYDTKEPSEEQLHAAESLIELGIALEKVSPNYVLNAHMSREALYNVVKEWPHFVE